ncbi:hypothetical protein AB0O47_37775, partial [Streptomyces noursei]|uniref:hypothetical protein n=1 Tax=Streptomyces noursei TaxID=1971 RepID=UPI00344B8E80
MLRHTKPHSPHITTTASPTHRPEPLTLERIRRQVGPLRIGAGEEVLPVVGEAARVQAGPGRHGCGLLAAVLAQEGYGADGIVVEGLPRHGAEDAVRAEFQEGGGAVVGEGTDAVGETDRLAD